MKLTLTAILTLCVIGLGVWLVGRWDGIQSKQEVVHQARVDQALRTAKPHHARNDSLRALVTHIRARARQRLAADTQIAVHTDSVKNVMDALPIDTLVPLRIVKRLVTVYEHRVSHLRAGALMLDSALTLETARADSAEYRVSALELLLAVRPERCRIVVFPCPSRTTAFVAGGVIGVLAGVALTRD